MTLHEAIELVLMEYGWPMTTGEIVRVISGRNLYEREDAENLSTSQVAARISSYPEIFAGLCPV